jgi:hypothetical protein
MLMLKSLWRGDRVFSFFDPRQRLPGQEIQKLGKTPLAIPRDRLYVGAIDSAFYGWLDTRKIWADRLSFVFFL